MLIVEWQKDTRSLGPGVNALLTVDEFLGDVQ